MSKVKFAESKVVFIFIGYHMRIRSSLILVLDHSQETRSFFHPRRSIVLLTFATLHLVYEADDRQEGCTTKIPISHVEYSGCVAD